MNIHVGDTVRIIGHGLDNGSTGTVVAINTGFTYPIAIRLGHQVKYFAYEEVVKE